jgi:hypothetical protein
VARHVADAIDVGDRSAAKFHHQTGHNRLKLFNAKRAAAAICCWPAQKGAYR